ncbi:MAG: hypothetical protein KDA51_02525 [Planctomycetales bacterium]|nr:hypothetical protein [Planctomycetales bacterium]
MIPICLFRTLPLLLFGMILIVGQANAAETRQSNSPDCALQLSGKLVAGDFEAFSREAQAAGLVDGKGGSEARNADSYALCLDSEGGSYHEGRLIAEKVHSLGISTRVRPEARCFSACANIFMAGRSLGDEVDGPSRILHIGGQLGFHAPYYRLPAGQSIPPAQVERIVTQMNVLLSDFIRFGSYSSFSNSRPMFSLSLFQQMLAHGPDEVALVDTVEELARWGIRLEGHKEAAKLTDRQRVQACVNHLAWSLDQPSQRAHDLLTVSERVTYDSFWPDPVTFAVIETGGLARQYCNIEITKTAEPGILVCTWNGFNGLVHGDCKEGMALWEPWYWALPPDTKLVDLR